MIFFFQIAARNCRKRKGEQILQLEEELEIIRRSKQGIKSMNEDLIKSHADWSARLKTLERKMLDKMLGPGHLSSSLVLKDSKIQLSQSSWQKKYFTLNLCYSHQCCYEYHLLFVLGFIMMTSEVQNLLFQDMFMHASSHSTWYLKCNNVFVVALVTTCSHNVQWCHMPLPILNNFLLWISF